MQEKVNASAAFPAGYFGGTVWVGGNLEVGKAASKHLTMKFGPIVAKSRVLPVIGSMRLCPFTGLGCAQWGATQTGMKKAALLGRLQTVKKASQSLPTVVGK